MSNERIGILTFHRALNYGAVFQTYALERVFQKLDTDVEIIDYRASFNEKRFARKKISECIKPRQLYYILFRNAYSFDSKEVFSKFTSHLKMSLPCSNQKELSKICKKYEKIVCGSDQVWNIACTEGDDSYFLPFINNIEKKTSYAASIGYEVLPDRYKEDYRKWISNFSAISVREKTAQSIVYELTKRDASYVLDPTLLLSREEWEQLADFSRVPNKRFVVLYVMFEDKKLLNFAKNLAKREKCELIYINERLFKLKGAKNLRKVTPEQWLGLFLKADYIVTNSFHGTAFSVNFNKQFYVGYIPRSIANTRLKCILEEYNLNSQVIDNDGFGKIRSFDCINKKLSENRKLSIKFIELDILRR